jgi:hypothetical protein
MSCAAFSEYMQGAPPQQSQPQAAGSLRDVGLHVVNPDGEAVRRLTNPDTSSRMLSSASWNL